MTATTEIRNRTVLTPSDVDFFLSFGGAMAPLLGGWSGSAAPVVIPSPWPNLDDDELVRECEDDRRTELVGRRWCWWSAVVGMAKEETG